MLVAGQVACFVSHNDGLLCREVPPPASGTPGLSGNEREGEQMNNIESIRDLIAQSRNAEALDAVRASVSDSADPPAAEAAYLACLACVRMGAFAEAQTWYGRLDLTTIADASLRSDALGVAVRISKLRFAALKSVDEHRAIRHAVEAFIHYKKAFDEYVTPYAAINAAAMAWIIGENAACRQFAHIALIGSLGLAGVWPCATRAEAHLLLGDVTAAQTEYRAAYGLARGQHGLVASMRRQLDLLAVPGSHDCLNEVPAPVVIAFTGHMLDRPDREVPRFTGTMADAVARRLREKIDGYGQVVGFSQAACGADILFLEAMQEAGMQTTVVLPFSAADYLETSVTFAGPAWVARHRKVLANATRVVHATEERYLGDDVLFQHAADLIQGMAFLRASELATTPHLLVVAQSGAESHLGGTVATATRWNSADWTSDCIELEPTVLPALQAERQPMTGEPMPSRRTIHSFMFADVTGFSKMPEEYTPAFVDTFLTSIRCVLDAMQRPPVDANTRGDGLYLVFDSANDAAICAHNVLAAIRATDWTALGLPQDTTVRIGLHAGPAYRTYDPVMRKDTFYGSHVNRAARLEAIVQPGQIYATETFAALLAVNGETGFRCEYIGETQLPKSFGTAPLYRVLRTA